MLLKKDQISEDNLAEKEKKEIQDQIRAKL